MNQIRNYPVAEVTRKAQASLEAGHPWVFDAEVKSLSCEIENGCLADVVGDKGRYLGTGMYSAKAKIRGRGL